MGGHVSVAGPRLLWRENGVVQGCMLRRRPCLMRDICLGVSPHLTMRDPCSAAQEERNLVIYVSRAAEPTRNVSNEQQLLGTIRVGGDGWVGCKGKVGCGERGW